MCCVRSWLIIDLKLRFENLYFSCLFPQILYYFLLTRDNLLSYSGPWLGFAIRFIFDRAGSRTGVKLGRCIRAALGGKPVYVKVHTESGQGSFFIEIWRSKSESIV